MQFSFDQKPASKGSMSLNPFFPTLLLFIFSLCIFGQNSEYPNELADYRFYRSGKLKSLHLLVSSKDDVKHIFGEKCEKQCDYDSDWSISFEYFEDIWIKESSDTSGKKLTFFLDSRYLGKLRAIELRPKGRISFLSFSFPESFKRAIVTSITHARNKKGRTAMSDAYQDLNGLTYEIHNQTSHDDIPSKNRKSLKGDLIVVRYNITGEKEKGLFVLQN